MNSPTYYMGEASDSSVIVLKKDAQGEYLFCFPDNTWYETTFVIVRRFYNNPILTPISEKDCFKYIEIRRLLYL